MPIVTKFILTAAVIILTTLAGYACRRKRWIEERVGEWLMTIVAVFGYPLVGFFTVWGTSLKASDAMLPIMACTHVVVMTFLGLALTPMVTRDRAERGLLAVSGGLGNNGFTMGAFILYLLYGEQALGLANIYFVVFVPLVVVLIYPLARHFASAQPQGTLGELMRRSLLDWRSIGLPINVLAILISAAGVRRPQCVADWHLVDIMVYTFTPMAFFAIGLRLHGSKVLPLWRMIAWLGVVRFGLGAVTGLGLAWLTQLTPWGFADLRWNVYVVQSFMPTAVTSVAVANMFGLKPQESSVLFVTNTALYLVLILPLVFWLFG
ncbi:MAG: AEC family transporter [Verrucomicrobiota bacterium]